jgi:glycosyltransferase involved in cell wall biosynthesis
LNNKKEHRIKPFISVAMPVYNHGAFIARALDSILMQETKFSFEIVIGDDCSTDNTCEILLNYKEKHPDKIVLLLAEKNGGVNKSARGVYRNCKGKYIAFLEGDDYWINEHKLQKQIDFLEQNQEYMGCFHDAEIVSTPEADISKHNQYHLEYKYYSQFNRYRSDFYPCDVIERNIIPTASLVVRNSNKISDFFEAFNDITLSLNWAFQIFIIKDSKFRYINEPWSVYNDHAGGVSKTKSLFSFKLSNIKVLKRFVHSIYRTNQYSFYHTIAMEYFQILYIRQNAQMKHTAFLKYLFLFSFYSLKSFHFQTKDIINFRKNLKRA